MLGLNPLGVWGSTIQPITHCSLTALLARNFSVRCCVTTAPAHLLILREAIAWTREASMSDWAMKTPWPGRKPVCGMERPVPLHRDLNLLFLCRNLWTEPGILFIQMKCLVRCRDVHGREEPLTWNKTPTLWSSPHLRHWGASPRHTRSKPFSVSDQAPAHWYTICTTFPFCPLQSLFFTIFSVWEKTLILT